MEAINDLKAILALIAFVHLKEFKLQLLSSTQQN